MIDIGFIIVLSIVSILAMVKICFSSSEYDNSEKIFSVIRSCKTTRQLDIAYKWANKVLIINKVKCFRYYHLNTLYDAKLDELKLMELTFPWKYRQC